MFDIGFDEFLLILVVALFVYGPNKLPDLAKALGRGYAEFRRATNELKETFEQDETVREIKQEFQKAQHEVLYGKRFTEPEAAQPSVPETPRDPVKPSETTPAQNSVENKPEETAVGSAGVTDDAKLY
jgi:sec-independent protein translocase protein TatB